MRKKFTLFATLALLASFAVWAAPKPSAQDAKTVLSNASKAMGSPMTETIQYSGTGTEFAFGQAVNPDSPWPGFVDKSYTRTINYETPAWRVDRMLAEIPPDRRGGGLPPGPTQKHRHRREYAVGPASGPLDDAVRFPASRRKKQ